VRYGLSIPLEGIPLADQGALFGELEGMGYSDLWSSEANGTDAFVPLALAGEPARRCHLGTAVVPAFTRGPALLAMSVATMAAAFPGRFSFGVGSSSDVIVQNWNGIPFEAPFLRVRDVVRFLKIALSGEKVDTAFDTFTVRGFRLGFELEKPPPILIGALRPGMLHLAGREADGAVINWLSAEDVRKVVPEVGPGKEVVCRIFVCPSTDEREVRRAGRLLVNAYLNVPVYAAFHEWLGRGPLLEEMWSAWRAGDRRAAADSIPDEVVDALIVHGSADECRAAIGRYVEAGVTVPVIAPLPIGVDVLRAVRELAPEG